MLLQDLFEKAIETRPVEEVWADLEGSASDYSPSKIYLVKTVGEGKFEIYTEEAGKLAKYADMTTDELRLSFTPVRPNDKPDAEGYVKYKSREVLRAAEYSGEPINVDDSGATLRLKSGDFLVRSEKGNEFIYTVEPGPFIDNTYTKV